MMLEAALKQCGSPCSREKLVDALHNVSVQTAGIYPDPIRWTKDNHTRAGELHRLCVGPEEPVGEAGHGLGGGQERRASRR